MPTYQVVILLCILNAVGEIWCPGDKVEYSCTTSTRLVWSGTVFTGQCSEERIFISDNETLECGQMTATNVIAPDPNFPQYTIIRSTLAFIVRPEMMGATIMCITPLRVTLDTTLNIRSMLIIFYHLSFRFCITYTNLLDLLNYRYYELEPLLHTQI